MNIAIVEDEAVVARRLERSIRAVLGDRVTRVTLLPTLAAARDGVRTQPPDLLFLDLNLNGRDGFELLAESLASPCHTIVVSAYEDQAMRAFEHGVVDFVPKPWTEPRLNKAIERALGRTHGEPGRARRLAVRHLGAIEFVELDDVHAIRGADDYAELLMAGGARRLHEKTLAELERLLPEWFLRTHRSWIVNLRHVQRAASVPGGRARLAVGTVEVPVGRSYKSVVLRRLPSS